MRIISCAEALKRAIAAALKDKAEREETPTRKPPDIIELLTQLTDAHRLNVLSQRVAREVEYSKVINPSIHHGEAIKRFEDVWSTLEGRLIVCPGKTMLQELRDRLSAGLGISLTNARIVSTMREEEIPSDLCVFLDKLEAFRLLPVA